MDLINCCTGDTSNIDKNMNNDDKTHLLNTNDINEINQSTSDITLSSSTISSSDFGIGSTNVDSVKPEVENDKKKLNNDSSSNDNNNYLIEDNSKNIISTLVSIPSSIPTSNATIINTINNKNNTNNTNNNIKVQEEDIKKPEVKTDTSPQGRYAKLDEKLGSGKLNYCLFL
jgi:hypothetical protein